MSWIKYDSTRADWLEAGDTVRYGSMVLCLTGVDDTINPNNVMLRGTDEMDDDVEIFVPADDDIALVYWNYEE